MSEAEESAGEPVPGREVWIEKYRPQTLDDIHGQESIVDRLKSYIDENDLPHLLFSGQAGIGKCVTGETPVLTNDGVQRIESVVGDTDGFADATRDRTIVTFDRHGEFDHVSPSHVFRKEATDLRRVVTRDGNEMTVTPEHKFLTVGNEGLAWKTVEDAEPGDRIVRPLEIPLPSGEARLDWLSSMDGDKTLVYLPSEFVAEHGLPVAEVHDEAETDREVCCTLRDVRSAEVPRDRVEAQVRGIRYVNGAARAGRISVPSEMSPTLARFVGLSISEARIENGRIKFYNTDEALLDQFTTDADTLFGITPTVGEQKQVEYREIGNRTLTHFLESCFEVFDANERTDGIGSTLVQADADSRRAFLKAVYDCEGYVSKQGTLELTQKDERVVTLVAYLLSGFGVPARRRKEWKAATNGSGTEREYHTLYVSGSDHLARFTDEVGFTVAKKQRRLESGAARSSNPNFDTVPVQSAVDDLCDRLNLDRKEFLPESLNPETPGRDRYQRGVDALLDVASDRIETAQETLERLDELEPLVQRVTALPTVWLKERSELDPISVRRGLAETTGVRKDRLLEYSDGRRTPSASRTGEIVSELGTEHETPPVESVREELHDAVESLGTTYEAVAERVDMHGSSLQSLLEGGNDLRSLTRFQSVLDALRTAATEILSRETLELVSKLDVLASAELYFDEVESVERIEETRDVYDLTVPESRNYVAGQMPTVVHNTTAAQAIAREIYGDNWQQNFLELNASDQRGIDVVRDRIKSFARESFSPDHSHTLIFLDEADSLCLPPGTEILTGYPSSGETKKIEEVAEDGESIPSVDFETNEIQSDSGHLVDSGVADFFEIELSDGREITASPKHPFFVVDGDEKLVEKELRELQPGDEIADFRDDAGVSRCDACGGWTTGRFCSVDCKNDGHSREMQGEGNPMHGTEWSDDRREKIIRKLSDGRLSGENNPNYGGTFEGVHIWEMDEESVERFREMFSEMRSGTSWEEWVTDADAETVKQDIGQSSAEWWEGLDEAEREEVIKKRVESTDYPVCDITGDANPMRDPETAQKVSEALEGHEPTGGNIRYSEELGHLVRSDWEYDVAKKLQDADVEYEYEPAFDLSDSVYHPDFLVGDTIIEVKGVAELWGQTDKVEAFLERYGDEYDFLVVGDGEMPHDEHYEKGDFDAAVVSDGGRATVSTAEVQRIEYSHRGKAYNISMDGTPNFMLANGVLTHNTDDAQSALRRTMEQFSDNTRFILSCNYSSKIIDPIQSRCAVFRFSPLSDDAIESQVREIAETEGIEITEEGMDALVYAADGDMRRAINNLQGAATSDGPVDETTVYEITATARPEEIESMVSDALDGDFSMARATLDTLLTETGIAGGDVIDQLHRSVWEFDLDDREAVRLLERIGEADYRITEGANEQVQLEALLASLALEGE